MEIATRRAVYAAIDSERAYQDQRWTMSTSGGKNHTLAEWVLYMDYHRIPGHD